MPAILCLTKVWIGMKVLGPNSYYVRAVFMKGDDLRPPVSLNETHLERFDD